MKTHKSRVASPMVRTKSVKVKSADERGTPSKRSPRRSLPVKKYNDRPIANPEDNMGSIILSSDEEEWDASKIGSKKTGRKVGRARNISKSPTKRSKKLDSSSSEDEEEIDADNEREGLHYKDAGRRAVSDDDESEDSAGAEIENRSLKKKGVRKASASPAKRPSRGTTDKVNYSDAFEAVERSGGDESDEVVSSSRDDEDEIDENVNPSRTKSSLKTTPKSREKSASLTKKTVQQVNQIDESDSDGDDVLDLESDEDSGKVKRSASSKPLKRPIDRDTSSEKEKDNELSDEKKSGSEDDDNYVLPGTRKRSRANKKSIDERGAKRFKLNTSKSPELRRNKEQEGDRMEESDEEISRDAEVIDKDLPVNDVDKNLEHEIGDQRLEREPEKENLAKEVGGENMETEILEELNRDTADDITPDSPEATLMLAGRHSMENSFEATNFVSPRIQNLKICPPDCQCPPIQVWYGCRICLRLFERPHSLIEHRRTAHENRVEVDDSNASDDDQERESEIEPDAIAENPTSSPNQAVKRKLPVSDDEEAESDASTVYFNPRKRVAKDTSCPTEAVDADEGYQEVMIESSD